MSNWTTIGKSFFFSSAHRLFIRGKSRIWNLEQFGKCYNMHGHNYKLTVEVSGNLRYGMVMNYNWLSNIVDPLVRKWDHKYLNELGEFKGKLVTAEHIALVARDIIEPDIPKGIVLSAITVQETDKTFARWIR